MHYFGKGAVEAGQRAEAHCPGDIQYGIIRAPQQVAGLGNPGVVHEVQRRHAHDFPKDSAEVGGAPMTQIRQMIDAELLHVIFFYIIQGRGDDESVVCLLLCARFLIRSARDGRIIRFEKLNPEDFNIEGEEQSRDAELISELLLFHIPGGGSGQGINMRILITAENRVVILKSMGI